MEPHDQPTAVSLRAFKRLRTDHSIVKILDNKPEQASGGVTGYRVGRFLPFAFIKSPREQAMYCGTARVRTTELNQLRARSS
jgi:hypothetical protein